MEEGKIGLILDRLTRIETKLDDYNKIKEEVHNDTCNLAELSLIVENHQKEIAAIQENNKWLIRAFCGACITGVVGLFFLFAQNGIGV